MSDVDLSRALGRLEGSFDEIKGMLRDQNVQHVRDKEEAKSDQDRRHEENKTEFRQLRTAIDSTATIAQDGKKWIDDEGRPLVKRVGVLESDRRDEAAENRGRKAAFGIIYAAIGAGLTALGAVSGDAIAAIRGIFHGG